MYMYMCIYRNSHKPLDLAGDYADPETTKIEISRLRRNDADRSRLFKLSMSYFCFVLFNRSAYSAGPTLGI